ncbi:hypothetical protein GCM10007390_18390 [Persicitalea jodogahamensis]|uniref:Uncharacterized protein n=1 Tax=Persicitalea jodogahamensis TaxID=402147 RepID=A0A8J3D1N1_9BACT|nr:hypothetical protein GCM10007390_18390 [Persicitalea jodogahamensis]
MENKKVRAFPFLLIIIVIGVALFKLFDFETLTFAKPALAIVYSITFLLSIYFLVRHLRK